MVHGGALLIGHVELHAVRLDWRQGAVLVGSCQAPHAGGGQSSWGVGGGGGGGEVGRGVGGCSRQRLRRE